MATFTAWDYEDPDEAEKADGILKEAAAEGLVTIVDTAWIRWDKDAKAPVSHHTDADRWRGAGWGALFGVLLGALIWIPVIGLAAGAAIGAIYEAVSGVGLKKEDVERLRDAIKPGHSVLMVVTKDSDVDRVAERFHGVHSKLVDANLVSDELKEVQADFNQD